MRYSTVLQGYIHQIAFCLINAFPDCFGNIVSFSKTESYFTFLIADNRQCRERKATSALNNLGGSVELDQLFYILFRLIFFIKVFLVIHSLS